MLGFEVFFLCGCAVDGVLFGGVADTMDGTYSCALSAL